MKFTLAKATIGPLMTLSFVGLGNALPTTSHNPLTLPSYSINQEHSSSILPRNEDDDGYDQYMEGRDDGTVCWHRHFDETWGGRYSLYNLPWYPNFAPALQRCGHTSVDYFKGPGEYSFPMYDPIENCLAEVLEDVMGLYCIKECRVYHNDAWHGGKSSAQKEHLPEPKQYVPPPPDLPKPKEYVPPPPDLPKPKEYVPPPSNLPKPKQYTPPQTSNSTTLHGRQSTPTTHWLEGKDDGTTCWYQTHKTTWKRDFVIYNMDFLPEFEEKLKLYGVRPLKFEYDQEGFMYKISMDEWVFVDWALDDAGGGECLRHCRKIAM